MSDARERAKAGGASRDETVATRPTAITRRTVLALAGAGTAAVALGRFLEAQSAANGRAVLEGLVALSPSEAAIVEAIGARIWPGSPEDPGAREAGTVHYVDRALAGPCSASLRAYRVALRRIDAASRARHRAAFVELDEPTQDEMLTALSLGRLGGVEGGREFFRLIRTHTLEGVFADPRYGGNRALAGWKAVGYPGPFYAITAEEQQSFTEHRMPFRSLADL